MQPVGAAQHLVVLATLIVCGMAAYILTRRPMDRGRSISMHVGDEHYTFLLFAAASTVGQALLWLFLWFWFIPTFQLGIAFTVAAAVAMVCQVAAAWVRYAEGRQGLIHSIFAYIMAALLPVLLGLVLLSPVLSTTPKIIVGAIAIWMVSTFIMLFTVKHVRSYYLPYQASYIAGFYVALLAATYLN